MCSQWKLRARYLRNGATRSLPRSVLQRKLYISIFRPRMDRWHPTVKDDHVRESHTEQRSLAIRHRRTWTRTAAESQLPAAVERRAEPRPPGDTVQSMQVAEQVFRSRDRVEKHRQAAASNFWPIGRERGGAWMREQGMFEPARLVFLDETATSTKMVRCRPAQACAVLRNPVERKAVHHHNVAGL
jgi:hypothetical protein